MHISYTKCHRNRIINVESRLRTKLNHERSKARLLLRRFPRRKKVLNEYILKISVSNFIQVRWRMYKIQGKISFTQCCIAWLSQNFIHALLYRVAVTKFHSSAAVSRGCHKISFTHCSIAWLPHNFIHALLYSVAITKLTRAQQHYVVFSTKFQSHRPRNIERRLQIHKPSQ